MAPHHASLLVALISASVAVGVCAQKRIADVIKGGVRYR